MVQEVFEVTAEAGPAALSAVFWWCFGFGPGGHGMSALWVLVVVARLLGACVKWARGATPIEVSVLWGFLHLVTPLSFTTKVQLKGAFSVETIKNSLL